MALTFSMDFVRIVIYPIIIIKYGKGFRDNPIMRGTCVGTKPNFLALKPPSYHKILLRYLRFNNLKERVVLVVWSAQYTLVKILAGYVEKQPSYDHLLKILKMTSFKFRNTIYEFNSREYSKITRRKTRS